MAKLHLTLSHAASFEGRHIYRIRKELLAIAGVKRVRESNTFMSVRTGSFSSARRICKQAKKIAGVVSAEKV
jgi:hypothetical protein